MSSDYRVKNTIELKDAKHFPVFTPGLVDRELIEDHGLKQSMGYLDINPPFSDHLTIDNLMTMYPKEMVNEMVNYIKSKMPDASEKQIVMTILNTQ